MKQSRCLWLSNANANVGAKREKTKKKESRRFTSSLHAHARSLRKRRTCVCGRQWQKASCLEVGRTFLSMENCTRRSLSLNYAMNAICELGKHISLCIHVVIIAAAVLCRINSVCASKIHYIAKAHFSDCVWFKLCNLHYSYEMMVIAMIPFRWKMNWMKNVIFQVSER